MTPLPRPPFQYLIGVTADEARAGKLFIAESLRPPVKPELLASETAAVSLFSKLAGVVEKEEKEGE